MKKKDRFPIENEGSGLPARAEDGAERQIAPIFDAPSGQSMTKKKKRTRSGRYVMILSICLMIAIFLLFYSIVLFLEHSVPKGETELSERETAEASERIVFVRQWDEDSGILSTPELYAACRDSVVSVRTQGEGGKRSCFGFLISEDGYVAVPSSALEGAESVLVVLADGRSYPALRAGSDSLSELGLLKIEERGLCALSFGDSRSLLMGDRVVAVGDGLVSTGELSSQKETVYVRDETGMLLKKRVMLRINALGLTGYEGAPLLNEYGEVIGMISACSEHVGKEYAIPSNGMKQILACMMTGEPLGEEVLDDVVIQAPQLGILGGSASEGGMLGVRIHRFASGLSSSATMLKTGDLILSIDGNAVRSTDDIAKAIEEKNPKDTVLVSVLRFGQMLTFEVTLA